MSYLCIRDFKIVPKLKVFAVCLKRGCPKIKRVSQKNKKKVIRGLRYAKRLR